MENEKTKNNSGLIILLVLIILGLAGYIVYDKELSNKTLENQEQEIKGEVKEETTNNEQNAITNPGSNKNIFKDIVGKYYYSDRTYPCGEEEYTELVLKEDGTYTYNRSGACASGARMQGTYSLTENKIRLYNELCTSTLLDGKCEHINCTPTSEIEYSYSNGAVKVYLYKDKVAEKQ